MNKIPTLTQIRGGQSKQIFVGASIEILSRGGQLKKTPCTYAELASEVKSNSKFSSICTQTCQNLEWGYLTNFEQDLFVQIHIEWQYLLRSFHEKYGGHHYFLSWRESWTKFEDWDWFNARNYCRWVISDLLVTLWLMLWRVNVEYHKARNDWVSAAPEQF